MKVTEVIQVVEKQAALLWDEIYKREYVNKYRVDEHSNTLSLVLWKADNKLLPLALTGFEEI